MDHETSAEESVFAQQNFQRLNPVPGSSLQLLAQKFNLKEVIYFYLIGFTALPNILSYWCVERDPILLH